MCVIIKKSTFFYQFELPICARSTKATTPRGSMLFCNRVRWGTLLYDAYCYNANIDDSIIYFDNVSIQFRQFHLRL